MRKRGRERKVWAGCGGIVGICFFFLGVFSTGTAEAQAGWTQERGQAGTAPPGLGGAEKPEGSIPRGQVSSAAVLMSSPDLPYQGRGQKQGRGQDQVGISVEQSVDQLCLFLDRSAEMWARVEDRSYKILVVTRYIERYGKQGVRIRKTPEHYVNGIDALAGADPGLLARPFAEVLKMVAVVDYDFDNGENADALARKHLGERAFWENKKRFQRPTGQVYQAR